MRFGIFGRNMLGITVGGPSGGNTALYLKVVSDLERTPAADRQARPRTPAFEPRACLPW